MRKVFLVLLIVSFCLPVFAVDINNIPGDYKLYYENFTGDEMPEIAEGEMKIVENGTWYLVCREEYGEDVYEYPCDGMVYTWYLNKHDKVVLNFFGEQIIGSIKSAHNIIFNIPFQAMTLFATKMDENTVECRWKLTPLFEVVSASGGLYNILATSTIETCTHRWWTLLQRYADIDDVKYIDTNEFIITIDVKPNSTGRRRHITITGNNAELDVIQRK